METKKVEKTPEQLAAEKARLALIRCVVDNLDELAAARRAINKDRTPTGKFLESGGERFQAHCWFEQKNAGYHACWIREEKDGWKSALETLKSQGLEIKPESLKTVEYLARQTFNQEKAHTFQSKSKANGAKDVPEVLFMRHLDSDEVNRPPKGVSQASVAMGALAILKERAKTDPELAAMLAALEAPKA